MRLQICYFIRSVDVRSWTTLAKWRFNIENCNREILQDLSLVITTNPLGALLLVYPRDKAVVVDLQSRLGAREDAEAKSMPFYVHAEIKYFA